MSKVLLVSVYDNGQQLQLIAEALRKYTEHDAIHVNIKPTYLKYAADVTFSDLDYKKKIELSNSISDCDFFILSEVPPMYIKKELEQMRVYHKIKPSNTIIRTGGTYVRMNRDSFLFAWIRDDWIFAGLHQDWTLTGRIGRIFPLPSVCPVAAINDPVEQNDGIIRVAFSPTKTAKGVSMFKRVIQAISSEYPNVVPVPITNRSWKESIDLKKTCQITFDQMMLSSYGNSAIEGMYLNHAVLSNIDDYAMFCYPDLPIISVHNDNELYEQLVCLAEHPETIQKRGKYGRDFVLRHHSPECVIKKLDYLIKFVLEKK